MKNKLWSILIIIIWVSIFVVPFLIYYVNHYLPKGTYYPTGEIICKYGDRGPCKEEYKEYVRDLNIPDWAKFFKTNGLILWYGLFLVGAIMSGKKDKDTV